MNAGEMDGRKLTERDEWRLVLDDKRVSEVVAVRITYCRLLGSFSAGGFLSQAVYWDNVMIEKMHRPTRWFWKTQEDWEKETTMGRREQEAARKALRGIVVIEPDGNERPIWHEERRGVPAKMHYMVDRVALIIAVAINDGDGVHYPGYKLMRDGEEIGPNSQPNHNVTISEPSQFARNCQTGLREFAEPDRADSPDYYKEYTETKSENTPYTGGGEKLLASKEKATTIASGSTLNGAGLKANTNGNGAAPTIPSGSSNTANQQPKYGYATSSLDQLATDAGVDAATCQSLVDRLANACIWEVLVEDERKRGGHRYIDRLNEAVTFLVSNGITTLAALATLIEAWEKDNQWRSSGLNPEALREYHGKKLREIEDKKARARATDPALNPMLDVDEWLVDYRGGFWGRTRMRRYTYEKKLAAGQKIRLAQEVAA